MAEFRYCIRGDIDLSNADDLHTDLQKIIGASSADVVVDCTQMTFIDSTGILVLVLTDTALEAQGRHMLVANLSANCWRVFDILNLTDMCTYERPRVISVTSPAALRLIKTNA